MRSQPGKAQFGSTTLWETVKDMVAAMATDTVRERLHAARCRWLFTVLYLGGLRAAEVAETRMGAFFAGATGRAWSAGGWR